MKTMMRCGTWVLPVVLLVAAGCAEDQTPRSYVQANAVSKDVFDGEWYYRTCVIRTDDESGDMAFPGDCSADWINYAGGVQVPRIRWMIDRDYLIAMRSYEYVEGSNVENRPYIGEPVLAFKILSHFDIRRDYNPTTGEEINVIVENDFDRHWSQRDFMRVDWSENLILTMDAFTAALYDQFDIYTREAAPSFIQEGGDDVGVQWPDAYRPRFLRTSAAEDTYDGVDRVTEYGGEGQLYYMDFVTNEVYSPGNVPDPYTGQPVPWCMSVYIDAPICTASMITLRNSFLKVPPNDDYEAQEWPDSRFDQFGFWRLGRPTYDVGDSVDPTDPNFAMTDFWTYPIGRINIWQRSTSESGERLPPAQRQVRRTYFYTTSETPLHLLRPAVRIAADWNRFYMKTVRILKNQPLPAWDDGSIDDKDWIFDPETGDAYTCSGGEPNVFGECPRAERTYSGAGYGCRMAIDSRDTGLAVPSGFDEYKAYDPNVHWDTDFDADRYIAMEGDECIIVGRVNSCVRHPAGRDGPDDPGEPCEERGDLRYSFISYVSEASTGWSGVSEMRSDPITGKYVAGDVNVGGDQLDLWRTRVLTEIDLETGNISEEEYMMGEMYREYMANLGANVDRPAIPQRQQLPPVTAENATILGVPMTAITANMERAFARAEQLKGERGRANIYSDRVRNLIGTDIERVLFDNEEMLAANDINMIRPGVTTTSDRRLDLGSHFRKSLPQRMADWQRMEIRQNRGDIMRPPVFVDATVTGFIDKLEADFPGILGRRPQLTFLLDAYLYIPLMEHEYGHLLGLRHNFGGSADAANYFPKYYDIVDANPMPDETRLDLWDTNGDGHLDTLELANFADEQTRVRQARELAGIKMWQNAAIMEYTGNWYDDLTGLPSYDPAALMFGYGDVVEVWERDVGTTPIPGRNNVHYWKYYHGGERCSSDADCPFASGGPRYGELTAEQIAEGAVQTCTAWNTISGTTQACSNFRSDVAALGGRFIDRKYKFCTDDQVGYRGDCSTFDEGANYREIVWNLRDYWERNYIRFNFRRYRYTFDYYPYLSGFMRFYQTAQKIFQEMFSKWAANLDNYRGDTGAFGFYDQYMASVDVLNWFIQTLAIPDVGSYIKMDWQNRYAWQSRFTDATETTELNVPLGVGKHTYSLYQGGLDGINRVERIGSLYDKIWTLELMLVRYWGYGYTLDEPYFVNMYDLFPTEIGHLMTGLIADEPGYFMPRVLQAGVGGTETRVIYPNFWNGACLADPTGTSPCWGEDPSLSALTPLESASFYVQMLGVTYGLSEIPTPFDPTFQEQAQIYVVGSGGGARVPPDARACTLTSTADCDYSIFSSHRFHRQYLAFKMEGDEAGASGAGTLGFAIIQKAATQQAALECCEQCLVDAGGEWGGNCEDPACENASLCAQARCGIQAASYSEALQWFRMNVDSYESFIRYLLQLQGDYGLNTWISYGGSLGK